MKKIFLFLILSLSFLHFFSLNTAALDIFRDSSQIIYCRDNNCSLEKGTDIVARDIRDIEKNRKASNYIQDIVKYLLSFITILAVIYIIYSGFRVLTSAGDNETVKKQKTTIVSVLIGIVIIWLAYPIVWWLIKMVLA